MSMAQDPIFETALSLPQAERADLAFLLLESLPPPGDAVSAEEFAGELRRRVEAYRAGEIQSVSLEDARATVERRLAEGSRQ
jgi:putative addiction module component (TIGR02574 family)